MVGRSSTGHIPLAIISSRQCRCVATCSNPGVHIAAFESPIKATVVVEAVSPIAHSGWPTSRKLRKQPLKKRRCSSAPASARGGSRLAGTSSRSAEAATAAFTWAKSRWTIALYWSGVAPTGGGLSVMVSVWAARLRPMGAGTTTSGAIPTQTAIAVARAPTARLARADRRRGAANRMGFSTRRRVSTASPAEKGGRHQPFDQPQWVAQQCRCQQQHRPVPQIPRIRHPPDRAHRRCFQDAPAAVCRCGAARADHQRRAQHR